MGNLDFNTSSSFSDNVSGDVNDFMSNITETFDTSKDNSNTESKGLSYDELNDPNKINVTIADKSTPIVILYGPAQCGKTMTLVRMTRFLRDQGYKINPIRTFRPSYDKNYEGICDNFDEMIDSDDAARSTERINFMLVEVLKKGRRICQILEAPGEYYFNRKTPNAPYPSFVNTIINDQSRKIWCVIVEPNWFDTSDRRNYVTRIAKLKQRMRPTDKTVFIFNKIDKTEFVISRGRVNITQARREIGNNLYPGLFTAFKNDNPITKFFQEYKCDFVPFQTGDYTETTNGYNFQEGPEEYPRQLWAVINKHIKG